MSVCSYVHICFSFERFVCPSVFVFLPPPSSPSPPVSGGRLRNDQSGFDAVGPCPGFLQHMRPGSYGGLLNQSPVTILFGDGSLMKYQCIWCATTIHTLTCQSERLDTASHMWQTGSAWVWRGISDGEGGKTTVASSSAIIRQDSPEEVRNQHPTWSMPPVLKRIQLWMLLQTSVWAERLHSWLQPITQHI